MSAIYVLEYQRFKCPGEMSSEAYCSLCESTVGFVLLRIGSLFTPGAMSKGNEEVTPFKLVTVLRVLRLLRSRFGRSSR